MTTKLIMALALTLGTSALAQAQTTTAAPETPSPEAFTLPSGWEGNIANAFFSDSMGTRNSEAETKAKWDALSAEEQTKVREHCAGSGDGAGQVQHATIVEICQSIEAK